MRRTIVAEAALLVVLAVAVGQAQAPPPPGALLAAPGTHGAMLHGHPLLPGTAILPGETVTTGPGGALVAASTIAAGGALELTGSGTLIVAGDGRVRILAGNALVYGRIVVLAPQGQAFLPATAGTRYVVNAGPQSSRLGVLAGAVGVERTLIAAGHAVRLTAAGIFNLQLSALTQPPAADAMAKLVPASISR